MLFAQEKLFSCTSFDFEFLFYFSHPSHRWSIWGKICPTPLAKFCLSDPLQTQIYIATPIGNIFQQKFLGLFKARWQICAATRSMHFGGLKYIILARGRMNSIFSWLGQSAICKVYLQQAPPPLLLLYNNLQEQDPPHDQHHQDDLGGQRHAPGDHGTVARCTAVATRYH